MPEPAADRSATPPADAEPIKGRGKAELFVIASIAHGKEYVDFTEDVYPFLSSDVDRRIYEYALDRFKKVKNRPFPRFIRSKTPKKSRKSRSMNFGRRRRSKVS
ncbi:MAG: hypothetical protein ACLUSP_02915 [Christensenellales bacterium]